MRNHAHRPRLLAAAGAIALGLAISGCASTQTPEKSEITGSVTAPGSTPRTEAEWRRQVDALGARYRADPNDGDVAMQYAQALRGIGQRAQAAAVLEQASIQNSA